jgi:stage III sporulation protein AF
MADLMEILNDIVRNIAFIVLLAAFVEMLLPGDQIGRYVRLIMGLFIIVTLLNPIVNYLDKGLTYGVTAWSIPANRELTTTVLQQGEEFKQRQEELALREYIPRLERQIAALVKLVPGVERAQASVELEIDQSLLLGRIKKVLITVWLKSTRDEKHEEKPANVGEQIVLKNELVAPIEVSLGTEAVPEVEHDRLFGNILQNVKTTVSLFYDLPTDKIVVTVGK